MLDESKHWFVFLFVRCRCRRRRILRFGFHGPAGDGFYSWHNTDNGQETKRPSKTALSLPYVAIVHSMIHSFTFKGETRVGKNH